MYNMLVKTGVEQMVSWIETMKQPTFLSDHTSALKAMLELHSDMSLLILFGQMWRQEFSMRKTGRATWQLTSKQKEEAKESEQMMNEYVQRRHKIQKAQVAAVHILEWRDHNLDIAPEAKIDGDAGGRGGEGAIQAQEKTAVSAKKKQKKRRMERSRVRHRAGRWMHSKKWKEHTFGTFGLNAGTNTDSQNKSILVRWPLHWEATDRSDGFLEAIRAYFRAMEMLEMTKEQSEENFERKATWATIAIDSETATVRKIPTARGQAVVEGMKICRHKGQVLRQMWKQMAFMVEVEEITELLTEQASDITFVGVAEVEGFATGAK